MALISIPSSQKLPDRLGGRPRPAADWRDKWQQPPLGLAGEGVTLRRAAATVITPDHERYRIVPAGCRNVIAIMHEGFHNLKSSQQISY
jgi:hypothetical protein